jgi:hypothetical protein
MGLLASLFERGDGPAVTLETAPPEESYIRAELEGTRSLCGWDSSPDREWLGLYTCSTPRRVALVRGETGQFMRGLDRPGEIAVANGGRLAVTDDHDPDADGGTLYVFEPDGTVLLEREYDSNLGDIALSTDGRYAAVATSDSAVALLDVDTGERLARAEDTIEFPHLEFDDAHGVPVVALFETEDDDPVETLAVETT